MITASSTAGALRENSGRTGLPRLAILGGRTRRSALAFLLAATVAALLHVHVRLQVIDAGYRISHETRLRHALADQQQKLRLELAMRRDPSVVERRARDELHMAPPDPAAIRVVPAAAPEATR